MDKQLKHMIGQMLSAGFPSPVADEQAHRLVEEFEVGNYYVFGRNLANAKQICELTGALTQIAYQKNGVAPFICLDQEGGAVSRIVEGASLFPGAMALAASGTDEAYLVGKNAGEVMRAMGITSTASPVLDVNVEPLNPIIGARAFSDDPEFVARIGTAMMKGLMDGGLIATVKHYPGHGNVKSDSHLELPYNDTSRETLESTEWMPFQKAFDEGADALMTAHVVYPAVDPDRPATLSRIILTDILRKKQNFKGIVATDCMEMNAVKVTYGIGESAVMAIEAGCDLLTFSHTIEAVSEGVKAIYEAVESGRIPKSRIEESYNRIMNIKKKYGLLVPPKIDAEYALKIANSEERISLNTRLSRQSLTLLKDTGGLEKLKNAKNPLFLAPPSLSLNGAEDVRVNPLCFSKKAVNAMGGESHVLPLNEFNEGIEKAIRESTCDAFVMGLYNARFRKGQVETLRLLESLGKPLIVIMLGAPYDLSLIENADSVIASYEYTTLSVDSIIYALKTGEFPGSSPVAL